MAQQILTHYPNVSEGFKLVQDLNSPQVPQQKHQQRPVKNKEAMKAMMSHSSKTDICMKGNNDEYESASP